MEEALPVRPRERPCYLKPQVCHLVGGEWAAMEDLAEGFPFDVLHHDEVEVSLPTEFMHLSDVSVAHGRGEAGLVEEHPAPLLVAGGICGEDLDRDSAAQDRVLGLPDDPHPSLADFLDEAVVGKRLARVHTHGPTPCGIILSDRMVNDV